MSRILGAGLVLGVLVLVLVTAWPSDAPTKRALRPGSEAAPPAGAPAARAFEPGAPEVGRVDAGAAAELAPEPSRAPAPPPRDARVTLYQHAHLTPVFPGDTWTVGFGLTEAGTAFRDEDVSAVEVPEGLSAALYDGAGATGRRVVLGPGLHNLAPYGLNDRVSSVRVMEHAVGLAAPPDSVVLYRDVVLEGDAHPGDWRLVLPRGTTRALYSAARGDFEAATLSALSVPPGYEVTLFEQPDGRGLALVVGPGYHELEPAGFNDRVRSLRVALAKER